jgi:pullulanase/glycogen debranching enzyme
MDRNSYNSGDWFNRVDYTMETHNWGIGLPPARENMNAWEDHEEFMTNPNINVEKEHMEFASKLFQEQLRIRYSSPLFRLEHTEEIHQRVAYHNTGTDQIPGIIMMSISDGMCAGKDLDSETDGLIVLFNAHIETQMVTLPVENVSLHSLMAGGADDTVKDVIIDGNRVTIPALTSLVFVKQQQGMQGDFPCNVF